MKKILQVVGALGVGGDTTAIMNMARYMDHSEFQMDFLSHESIINNSFVEKYRSEGGVVHLVEGDMREMGVLKYYKAIYKVLKGENYDIVHVHTSFQSAVVLFAARMAGVKSRICHSHTTMIQRPLNKFLMLVYLPVSRWLIRIFSTQCVACGSEAGHFLFGGKDFTILYNGIDIQKYTPQKTVRNVDVLAEYDLKDKIIIGQVGTIKQMKNQEFSIRLCSGLKQNYEMFFVGTGRLKEQLEKETKSNPHIHFLGRRTDIPDLMRRFDVLLLPSLPGEGLPVTAIEAQACGCPCIMSEYITREADLGMGLVKYVSLNDLDMWRMLIRKKGNSNIDIAKAVSEKGFNEMESSIKWINIYKK